MVTHRDRRIQRRRTEEIMSWVFVPLILIMIWIIGWMVWNAAAPERNTSVQTTPRPAAPGAPR
jgi:hypothetical protein